MSDFTTPPSPRVAHRSGHPTGGALGYTLTEIIVSILIISILAAIAFQFSSKKLRMRAERTGCESHLKTLYSGFSSYMIDNDGWPQMPDKEFEHDEGPGEEGYWQWWIDVLKPYGVVEGEWMCPTDLHERNATQKKEERDKVEGSYLPTHFSAGPDTPRSMGRQPWLLERGDFHGEGPLLIFPDGAVEPWPWPNL